MYIISKEFHFSASHQLDTLPPSHQCAHLHGHNYIVELVLQGEAVDRHGFVVDYLELKPFKEFIDQELDHKHLNDVMDCPTSAENIARFLFDWAIERWPQVSAVRVSETPKTWAEYRQS
ncbi:MAG: 6-carboxytetrahydropterin synthase [Candidatus Promineifilaceae bacterium]